MNRCIAALGASLLMSSAVAAVPADQVQRLGADLTPLGAEKAGNAAGTIPPWEGGLTTPPESYVEGKQHTDPFAGEVPLYEINAGNLDTYRELLSPGHQQLVANYPDYKLRVFPSHRTAAAPEYIYERTRENAGRAELISRGNGIKGAAAGVPFPIPANGLEVIWNHILRYRGNAIKFAAHQAAVQRGGSYTLVRQEREVLFEYGQPDITPEELSNKIFYYKYQVTSPAKLAGNALLVHETLDQILSLRSAWRYLAGQRRVRRLPVLAYDDLSPDTDGMLTTDSVDMYNGAPNLYEWNLIGKKEMLVPYNAYPLHSDALEYEDVLGEKSINQDHGRYELHRVWIVEATLRDGVTHRYAKRRFYVDEDSWQILMADMYNEDLELQYFHEGHPINYYNVPLVASTLEVTYNFDSGRYFADGLDNQERPYDFDVKNRKRDFSSSAMRRKGRK
ncbi:DUF1329 domain-containing protein [Aestuariirhabdus sp. Z084]|uniref:DUF1329 domain-containing protein n=1 Tax=Aestuariirhabdus haliotis TaxID=2918751 RepID=UPI00201B419B|nr:DUF1329 domain-containing protein [Aestuariirhabdus haliotis]MCL6414155.1 DUF1329 domain-containing protein [Aestuariirhabdus haliotis]MCL6418087.1 DUF1329 domain-containing protein [Aestuariirhabdus haliotis]